MKEHKEGNLSVLFLFQSCVFMEKTGEKRIKPQCGSGEKKCLREVNSNSIILRKNGKSKMNLFGILDEGRGDFLYKRAKVPKFGRDPLVFTALKFYTVSNRQRTALNKQKHRERLLKVPGGKENRGRFTVIYR